MQITPELLEEWVARAKRASARLSRYGIPCSVEVKYDGGHPHELKFNPSPFAMIALMELLANGIEGQLQPDQTDWELN